MDRTLDKDSHIAGGAGVFVSHDNLFSIIEQYSWLISLPMYFLPSCLATYAVVPEPIKGS